MNDGAHFKEAAHAAVRLLAQYLDESRAGDAPVVTYEPAERIAADLDVRRWMRDGGLAEAFAPWLAAYLERTTRLHHPAYLAHQVAVPHYANALATLIDGLTNNPMALYEMGPAAATIELSVLDWMLEKTGWGASGAGVLTHGGSLANLTALLAARAAVAPDAWDEGTPRDLVVLASPAVHYSIARAVSILGLGQRAIRPLETDAHEVIVPDALPPALRRAREEGHRPMAVVAAACATSTGLYDPLEEIGHACREAGVWLHVDGAHGASALISPRDRGFMRGVELADSLSWDAHKMLRVSGLCTAVLFRRAEACAATFRQKADYLFYGSDAPGPDLIHRTVECTKAGLGLKLFFVLGFLGETGLAAYIESRHDAARRFYEIISRRPGFSCPCPPQSNIVCFRYGDDDARQVEIREALLQAGTHHLSSTTIHGRRYLRLAVMSPDTDDAVIEGMLDSIEDL